MTRQHSRASRSFFAAVAIAIVSTATNRADASLIAMDSYTIGSNGYVAGASLKSQASVSATGFLANSTYSSGSGTSNFVVNAGGLAASDAASAGHVSYVGYASDNAIRSNARSLASPVLTASSYWFSIQVSQDGTSAPLASATNGYALAGFGNTTPPTLGATTTTGTSSGSNSYLQGLFFGFAHEPGDAATASADLVIRARNTTGYTSGDSVLVSNAAANLSYSIIARLDVNVNGGSADLLTYWVNATNTSSVAALDASSLVTNDGSPVTTYAFQTSADFARLTYSAQNWGGDAGSASFGDPTMGTSLADLAVATVAVPEPSSFLLLGLGVGLGLGGRFARCRTHRRALV